MNKKLNTALFVLGATVMNMLLIFIIMIALIALTVVIFPDPSPGSAQVVFLMVFVLSIGLSFLIYNKLVKFFSKKIDMDKYFHPIFKSRKR